VVSAPAASSSTPNKVNRNSTKNDGTITHMVDAVAAAMAAARKKDRENSIVFIIILFFSVF
jgi:hypothetical protein